MNSISRFKSIQEITAVALQKTTAAVSQFDVKISAVADQCFKCIKNLFENKKENVNFSAHPETDSKVSNAKGKEIKTIYQEKLHEEDKPQKTVTEGKTSETKFTSLMEIQVKNELRKLENKKTIDTLTKQLNQELTGLETKITNQKNYLTADDEEKLTRLKLMQGKIESNPDYFITKIQEYGKGKNDLFSHLGPVEFLSMLVKSDQNIGLMENIKKGYGNPSNLSELERVALYNYTTAAYYNINEAGRQAKLNGKEIQDPRIKACFQLTMSALAKLPDASVFDEKGNKLQLNRGYNPPRKDPNPEIYAENLAKFEAFCKQTFVKDNEFNDGAFLSTSTKEQGGSYNVIFEIPAGSTVIPGGKKIGFPYSAFSGSDKPDEGEILFGPNSRFEVTNVVGNKVTFSILP